MYNKIVVPLDGSPHAECVLDHVKALVAGCQVREVVVLYVVEPINPGIYEVPLNVMEDAHQKAVEAAKEYVAQISDKLKAEGLSVNIVVMQGRAADTILDYVRDNSVDLVVMSTHGRSGLSRFFLGSVADRVIRHATVPVLMVTPPGCRVE